MESQLASGGRTVTGLVLAAGEGARLGGPKALLREPNGESWVHRVASSLRHGGCDEVMVVLGAGAAEVEALVPDYASAVIAQDWPEGIAGSLRDGLQSASGSEVVLIAHVDVPDLPPAVVERMLHGAGEQSLRQAEYGGRPGHPVVVGGAHVAALIDSLRGDSGGRQWLLDHGVEGVECGDLFDGADIDTPEQLAERERRRGG